MNARAFGQITSIFLTLASRSLYEIRQPPTSLGTTSNLLIFARAIIVALVIMVARVMVVMVILVVMVVMVFMVVMVVGTQQLSPILYNYSFFGPKKLF